MTYRGSLLAVAALLACNGPSRPTSPKVPTLSRLVLASNGFNTDTLAIGEQTILTATNVPGPPNKPMTFASRNAAIATVAQLSANTARVTGVAVGSTYIVVIKQNNPRDSARIVVIDTTTPPDTTPPPPTGTRVEVGQSIQAAVDANPAGAAFVLASGVHRMQSVTPKSGNTFTGEAGAVMSGARLLTSFVREGAYWVATGQTQENTNRPGNCKSGSPRCAYPEDLFIDNVRLAHVSSLGAVTSGKWFFDYANDKIYFADDPTGKTVETGVTTRAFGGSATNVTVKSMTVEKYANPAQSGAVHPGGSGWLVRDVEVRWNHGEGVRIASGAQLRHNNVHHNGQQGVGGTGQTAVIDSSEIAYNNTAGYDPYWAAGGMKITGLGSVQTTDVVVSNNTVHHNDGPGLWCDFNCARITYDHNTITDNTFWAIQHEISQSARITGNTVAATGGGIFVSSSSDVEVDNNTVTGGGVPILGVQDARGSGSFGAFIVQNMYVHDNNVTISSGQPTNYHHVGILVTNGDATVWTGRNNRFVHNAYTLNGAARPFAWSGVYKTWSEWQAAGQDLTGSVTP